MNLSNWNKAFSLIELLVAISVIWLLALWTTSIDFNRLNNNQKIEIFTNKIKTNIESVRNKALSWKWIWTDLTVPQKWSIDFSKMWSWTIVTKAIANDSTILDINNFTVKSWYNFSSIKCWKYGQNESDYKEMNNTWTIDFIWWDIKLIINPLDIDCWVNESRILLLNVNKISNNIKIKIDTLSWLIQIKK